MLYQRYVYGSYPGVERADDAGAGSFGGAPDYMAANSDSDTSLRVTNLPNAAQMPLGGMTATSPRSSRGTR